MSDLRINNITDRTGDTGPVIAGVSTVSSTSAFTVPVGPTEYRGGRGRGVIAGGYGDSPLNAYNNTIEYVEIATTGNGIDFGDLSVARYVPASFSSSTRGINAGGEIPSNYSLAVDYVTISSQGGAVGFGNLKVKHGYGAGLSDNTRGLVCGGHESTGPALSSNVIEFFTIASTGDGADFGDLTQDNAYSAGLASPTRGVIGGGYFIETPANVNYIDYVTIQTRGNAIDFGDLNNLARMLGACSSTTRGIFAGGGIPYLDVIEYVTIATIGNATDFGDLTQARGWLGGTSNQIRGIFAGGYTPSPTKFVGIIDYITIASIGNASKFGDLSVELGGKSACSDAHGGLG